MFFDLSTSYFLRYGGLDFLEFVPGSTTLNDMLFEKVDAALFDTHEYSLTESEKLFYSHTQCDLKRTKTIEKQTRMQSKNAKWFAEREHRITASSFGTFCRMKSCTDPCKTFAQKKAFFTTRSVKHGIMYENSAFAQSPSPIVLCG